MVKTKGLKNYSDVHYTSKDVSRKIVGFFQPSLPCLEPFAGEGSFLEFLPEGTEWCEISEGKDFENFDGSVSWIVTNPPFEELTKWMEKSFSISENVVFLVPLSKIFSSAPRMELIRDWGGIKTVLYLGRGREIGFDIGFPFGAFHFQRDYRGPTRIVWEI